LKYPKQGSCLGKKVKVTYYYNTKEYHLGKIIRDDTEEPGKTIIQLKNGRVLLATECQYQILTEDYPDWRSEDGTNSNNIRRSGKTD